jgi:predicted phage terminase large subunit-like protein
MLECAYTSEQLNFIAHQARIELARRHFDEFVITLMPDYRMGWFLQDLCRNLESFLDDAVAGHSPRLMISAPPRHGKSELASRKFPAWAFGRYPDISIISASYSADLASRMNRDVQRNIDNDIYRDIFPETYLNAANVKTMAGHYLRNSDIFEIVKHKGSYRSAGVGGGITGMGGKILIIDDPVKDRAEADSPTVRQNVYDWYTSTLRTRLDAGGGILLIMTRWHEDDLAGRLLSLAAENPKAEQWKLVKYPAIATADEPFRKTGEPLHPDRYSMEELNSIRQGLPLRDWEALYQQTPAPDEGNVFRREWIRYYDQSSCPKRFERTVQSWDLSFKDTDGSDFVVGQVWGEFGGNLYLLDQRRGRMDFTESVAAIRTMSAKYPKAYAKLVEDKANGPAVINHLKNEISGLIPIEPTGSKQARAYAASPAFQAGNVFIPHPLSVSWVAAYEHELLSFPAGANDDQVDATSQAINYLKHRRPIKITDTAANAFKRGLVSGVTI